MEIRKFIVERHPDGKMTWCEYQEPDPYGFIAGKRCGINRILDLISKEVESMKETARLDETQTHIASYQLYVGAHHILSHCYKHLKDL